MLRRICIWNFYGISDGIGVVWWNYVTQFMLRCNNSDHFLNDDCINNVYKDTNVDSVAINRCMAESGGTTADNYNTLLEEEYFVQRERGVLVLPAISINNAPFQGGLTAKNIFGAICAEFTPANSPEICRTCEKCFDPVLCVRLGGVCSNSSRRPITHSPATLTYEATETNAMSNTTTNVADTAPRPAATAATEISALVNSAQSTGFRSGASKAIIMLSSISMTSITVALFL